MLGESTVQTGSRGAEVTQLQALLNVVGLPVAIDGIFGPATADAVRNFQIRSALNPTGIVDGNTWDELHGAASQTATPPASVVSNAVAKLSPGVKPVVPLEPDYNTNLQPPPASPVDWGKWLIIGGIGLAGVVAIAASFKAKPSKAYAGHR